MTKDLPQTGQSAVAPAKESSASRGCWQWGQVNFMALLSDCLFPARWRKGEANLGRKKPLRSFSKEALDWPVPKKGGEVRTCTSRKQSFGTEIVQISLERIDLREQIGCLPRAPGLAPRCVTAEPTIMEPPRGGKRENAPAAREGLCFGAHLS